MGLRIRDILRSVWMSLTVVMIISGTAKATERANLEAFLEVTGFGVALDSIALSASDAPAMLGLEVDDFGIEWKRMSAEVFDTGAMREMALEILAATLDDDLLGHAAGFYASDLGHRLVAAENDSHMDADDEGRQVAGQKLVAEMVSNGDRRLSYLRRMGAAIDASGTSVRAVQEIQVRFLLAASAAGVIDLQMDEDDLREQMKSGEAELRRALQISALASAAYVYRGFGDVDILAYTEALENPLMIKVYELMNAVQYEIMANRFEVLARKMAGLQPSEEL